MGGGGHVVTQYVLKRALYRIDQLELVTSVLFMRKDTNKQTNNKTSSSLTETNFSRTMFFIPGEFFVFK